MDKLYKSTRGGQTPIDFYNAILQGIASDGGLLVPDFAFEKKDLHALLKLDYVDLATEVISAFTPDGTKEEIRALAKEAYASGLFDEGVVPLKKAGSLYVAELFHGQTAAFKDMALSLLPHFMTYSLKKKGENREVMILAATSGDTGKAALEGFKDVPGTTIKVFYPIDGVSNIQKQQMVTTTGNNVEVVGIHGNFDDAQRAIVYYFHSYLTLVRDGTIELGHQVNFTVPSGNFGNCLAGWIAKQMGLPVHRFIVASNKNNILTDFFKTGEYDARREFYKTNAPAMDILVSSNLERLVYFMVNGDTAKVKSFMDELNKDGIYRIDEETLKTIQDQFSAGFLSEEEVLETIKTVYVDHGYLLDTHTAVGYGVYEEYFRNTGDTTPTVLLSTASPYKFPESVYEALTGKKEDVYQAIDDLHKLTAVEIPYPLKGIKDRKVLHKGVIDKEEILDFVAKRIEEL